MVEMHTYTLPSTPLIPNSPYVLIHYPRLLLSLIQSPSFTPATIYDIFACNGWQSQWVARYGPTQPSHYHSSAHECMAVISGQGATIRFGVADTPPDKEEYMRGSGHEDGGIELKASLGDVFILPAGVAHKTFDPRPDAPGLKFMAPEDGEGRVVRDPGVARNFFEGIKITGEFMMMGAYPEGGVWDFLVGGEHKERFGEVWSVPKPEKDPVLGTSLEGLCGLWEERRGNISL